MSAADALDEPSHVLLVGTGPVEAIAGGADTKIVVILSRSSRQPLLDGFLGDRLQMGELVTAGADLRLERGKQSASHWQESNRRS